MTLYRWLDRRPLLQCVGLSLTLTFVLETFNRRCVSGGFTFLVFNPQIFVHNMAIVMFTLSLAYLFRRRYFALMAVSSIWMVLGVTNFILLGFRTTPLAAIDFLLLMSVNTILSMYLSTSQVVLIVVGSLVLIIGMVLALSKFPKRKPRVLATISAAVLAILLVVVITPYLEQAQAATGGFGNLAEAYDNYGFAYCFARSLFDWGVEEPENHSQEAIARLLEAIKADEFRTPGVKPNIVMVQLESFFDVNYLKGLSYSENPVPVFTALKEEYPHGLLTVPSIGAGTANTEFEILSGMNLTYFGAGEYPYKTVLRTNTCESISYNLRDLGYTNHAIHNHQGTFYARNVVLANLGFDTFTPLEYMDNVDYTPLGWAKDGVLSQEIIKALSSTDNQDFVFAISVQGHGRYPEEIDVPQPITISGIEDDGKRTSFGYFINQLSETDAFIGDLIDQLTSFDEPVVLVLFGDHLPGLDIKDEELSTGTRFDTEYVIWSNFDLQSPSRDLYAYQLGAHVLEQVGIDNGLMTKLHQVLRDSDEYQEALQLLEYDLISGEQFAYGSRGPHIAPAMKLGTSDIKVTGVLQWEGNSIVYGESFTQWSQVYIDGHEVETTFCDSGKLVVAGEIEEGAAVVVAQVGDNTILSETEAYVRP